MLFHVARESWVIFNGVKTVTPEAHLVYLISSNLVDDEAMNAITVRTALSHVYM